MEWTNRVTLVLLTWYWTKPISSLPSHPENRFCTVKPADLNSLGVKTKQNANTMYVNVNVTSGLSMSSVDGTRTKTN